MKTNARIMVVCLTAGLFFAPQFAQAQSRHLDELALEIQRRAGDVCWDLHHHYRRHHDYKVVYRECYEMYTVAKHIHDIAHFGGSERRIARNTTDLDELFHHLEEHFHQWGVPSWHDHGGHSIHGPHDDHFIGNGHSRLARKMNGLGRALHHLMDDVGYESKHVSPYKPPPPGDSFDLPRP